MDCISLRGYIGQLQAGGRHNLTGREVHRSESGTGIGRLADEQPDC